MRSKVAGGGKAQLGLSKGKDSGNLNAARAEQLAQGVGGLAGRNHVVNQDVVSAWREPVEPAGLATTRIRIAQLADAAFVGRFNFVERPGPMP